MSSRDADFQATRWTLVVRSHGRGEEAKAALSDLCEAYYGPVVAFLRRDGRSDDEARELAHGFFETILTRGLGSPDQGPGRFRSYLLGALKHFLSKQRAAALAGKRGGGVEHVPLVEEGGGEPGVPVPGRPDDTLSFDREWALALIARALAALESEQSRKPEVFAALKPWLESGATAAQAEVALALGMSETAVKVAIHRLRGRFRELIRAEIAATVNDPGEAADELRHLIEVLGTA